ncbi:ankyrin [Backusella circina FSU 941]|nr:ankyrin [Backusella circina FSU 941]
MTDALLHKTIKKNKVDTKRHSIRIKEMFHNKNQREELMKACTKGDLQAVKLLLSQKDQPVCKHPDLIRDSNLRTPLLLACSAGHSEVVHALIDLGADVNNPMGDIVGNRPLDLAVSSNSVETVVVLLDAGAEINSPVNATIAADDGLPRAIWLKKAKLTPIDLAQSRLDILIKMNEQGVETRKRKETMAQLKKIIQLLKHYVPKNDVDELATMLESINLEVSSHDDVIKSLKDVMSKLHI